MARFRKLLFLLVLFLPSVAIIVQNRKIAAQEQERIREQRNKVASANDKRAEGERQRTAADIGKDFFVQMERIKNQELVSVSGGTLRRPGAYSDPAVVAVGWLAGEEPVWPWDLDDIQDAWPAIVETEVSRQYDEARRDMAAGQTGDDRRIDRARTLYRRSLELARTESERASLQLGWAKALKKSQRRLEAIEAFSDLLRLPLTVIDEDRYPFAWLAAMPLVDLGASGKGVLERMRQDLDSPAAFSPTQTYRAKSILEMLEKVEEPGVREGAGSALTLLSARMKAMDHAHDLLNGFKKFSGAPTDWQPFAGFAGKELLLVGRGPSGAGFRPLVIAVRVETVRAGVEAQRMSGNIGPLFQITASADSDHRLNEHIPGLQAIFALPAEAETPIDLNTQSPLWSVSFVLVIALTLFGGFLLWRDTRREARLAELRTQFVSSVSHELKTPLTSIRMFAEILQMRGHGDRQLHDEYLETIVIESERLTRLLNNVLDFSQTERGNRMYRFKPAVLTDVIRAAVRTVQYSLTEQGFILGMNLGEDIPPVAVDRDALQQAILNLLTNAMKYSGEKREIELRLRAENQAALIEVSDHGIGISEKEQSHIFEKYYRAHTPENREIAGAGLGLALVAHIVEAHGGSVRVRSKPGEGSTFSIRIPLNMGAAA